MSSCRRTAVAVAVLFLTGVPAVARAAESFQTRGPEGLYVLVSEEGRIRVELPSGVEAALGPYPSLRISSFSVLGRGFLAAGSRSTAEGRELVLVSGSADGATQVHLPATPQAARVRQEPVLLMREDRLVGLAWLEGRDRGSLGVRAAAWNGVGWEPVQGISPPGAGSQLALDGAVLDDGTWFVVWSAFDGQDDEVLWSRRRKESWSPPRRLDGDNPWPDITPSLVATADGALVAWSRYDGNDYRLLLARWQRGVWQRVDFAGEPGSLDPVLRPSDLEGLGTELLYQSVRPPGWTLLALDGSGVPRRRATVTLPAGGEEGKLWSERPVVRSEDPGAVVFRWPAHEHRVTVTWEPVP